MNNIYIDIGYICIACTTQRGRSSRIIIVLSMYSVKSADMYPYCTRSLSACKAECKAGYVRLQLVHCLFWVSITRSSWLYDNTIRI